MEQKLEYDVVIIGGGVAGSLTALSLPNKLRVLLLEKGDCIIPKESSTANSCLRLHAGMHYPADIATALECLESSILFIREFPECIVQTPADTIYSPWRQFHYYFMSNSQVSPEEARRVASILQSRYEALVLESPENAVFGPAETFITESPVQTCEYISPEIKFIDKDDNVSKESVVLAFLVAELQLDLEKFRSSLALRFANATNITCRVNTNVISVVESPENFGYCVVTDNHEDCRISTLTVVNSTWEQSEVLDQTAGLMHEDQHTRVNRLKASVLVELPENFPINTSIFSTGPYASFTVFPDRKAIITSERTTNVMHFATGLDSNVGMDQYLSNLRDSGQDLLIAEKIINEAADYWKEPYRDLFKKSRVIELHFGFVKMTHTNTYTYSSIFDTNSPIHARKFDGVEKLELGYVVNLAMKMVYGQKNSLITVSILQEDLKLIQVLNVLYYLIKERLIQSLTDNKFYLSYLDVFLNINVDRKVLKDALISGVQCYAGLDLNVAEDLNQLYDDITQGNVEKVSDVATGIVNKVSQEYIFSNIRNPKALFQRPYINSSTSSPEINLALYPIQSQDERLHRMTPPPMVISTKKHFSFFSSYSNNNSFVEIENPTVVLP